jgi:hypothetical protein
MNPTRLALATLILGLASFSLADDPTPLFNGKNLDGWVGNADFWSVEEGKIVGKTTGLDYNTFLITKEDYSDFVLKFQVNLANNNSGVQFRSEVVDPKKFVMAGYQADIAAGYWGLLYEERKRGMIDFKMDTKKLANTGEWVDMEVRAQGNKITITTNGTVTVQYEEKDAKAGATKGKIGLQLHAGPAMRVEFKNITLMRLDG